MKTEQVRENLCLVIENQNSNPFISAAQQNLPGFRGNLFVEFLEFGGLLKCLWEFVPGYFYTDDLLRFLKLEVPAPLKIFSNILPYFSKSFNNIASLPAASALHANRHKYMEKMGGIETTLYVRCDGVLRDVYDMQYAMRKDRCFLEMFILTVMSSHVDSLPLVEAFIAELKAWKCPPIALERDIQDLEYWVESMRARNEKERAAALISI